MTAYVAKLAARISSLRYSPPRLPDRKSYVEPLLHDSKTTHVYVRHDAHRPPLHPCYKGPFRVVKRFPKYFEVDLRTFVDKISVDRLKAACLSIESLNNNLYSSYTSMPSARPKESDLSSPSNHSTHNFGESSVPAHFSSPQDAPISAQLTTKSGREVRRPPRYVDYILD